MKIFSAEQIRAWDKYTIRHEPISSIDLMERAARTCTYHLLRTNPYSTTYYVLCGPGNNGGDGMAIARLLYLAGQSVTLYVSEEGSSSEDNITNLNRWKSIHGPLQHHEDFIGQALPEGAVIIDALFGTGNLRTINGLYAGVIHHVNSLGCKVVAIDMPSGLRADEPTKGHPVVKATETLTLGTWKLGLLMPENGAFTGQVHVLPIGLHPGFALSTDTPFEMTGAEDLRPMIQARNPFAHKGNFGTAMLLAGSQTIMGAAILSATACLRAGAGKLICGIPGGGLLAMQTGLPEAICLPDPNPDHLSLFPDTSHVNALGIGPGLGQETRTDQVVLGALENTAIPRVFDADALNTIARNGWQCKLGRNTAITPHIGEFHRLFKAEQHGFSRIKTALEFSTAR